MKKLLTLISLAAFTLGASSCCAIFGSSSGQYRTETSQVRACGYDTITEEIHTPGDAKSGMGGSVQIVEKKVPRYKMVTKKVKIPCPDCTRAYCPDSGCCGSTSEQTMQMATSQGATGSPHIGLIPTMRKLTE